MSEDHSRPHALSRLDWALIAVGTLILAYLLVAHIAMHAAGEVAAHTDTPAGAHPSDAPEPGGDHRGAPALWGIGIIPFIAILGAIAGFPLIRRLAHWWEHNRNRLIVALGCSAATLVYIALAEGPAAILVTLDHAIPGEYIPFIVLLFSLYVISGGINLTGDLVARPLTNTMFLAVGAGMASFIGTTGASMMLIRPLLQTNAERKHVVHTVVFFIFLVSNIGGTLLPIGDPPLFLGFIRGVDFWWTLGLWKQWLLACTVLLVIYFIIDSVAHAREKPVDVRLDEIKRHPLRLTGVINFAWLAGVVAAVAFVMPGKPFLGTAFIPPPFLREGVMLALVGLSLATTPAGVRAANKFDYHAIVEVAALFLGIFIAMQVPLAVLAEYGSALGLRESWHFFWATGMLSSVLDNAPTYVVFFETANALEPGVTRPITVIAPHLLVGISLGAVFLGAMTYIGNGPNFMVKAIAEQSGVRMPSFFGYFFKYAVVFLLPTFILVTFMLPATPAGSDADPPATIVEPAPPETPTPAPSE